jgi:hypothetical protein
MIVPIPTLKSYLDESSDEKQEHVFCVAACCATDKNWDGIQRRWLDRLQVDNVKYFRASSCKAVSGPFFHLRRVHGSLAAARRVAERIRADLENILLTSAWAGFMLGVVIPDYKGVLAAYPVARAFFAGDPTEHAYSQVMYEVTRTIRRKAKNHAAAFVIDQSLYSDKVIAAYNAMRQNHPTVAKTAKTILPLDDKETASLQVADLLASVAKDTFIEWLKDPTQRYAPLPEKWRNHFERIGRWDKPHFLRSLTKTLESPRLKQDKLARRARPEHKLSKRERKKIRREIIANLAKEKK